jgi:peptide/nickel transport system substrate-binding protein
MPALVETFALEADPAKRKALADQMQVRVLDQAPELFLGQFSPPAALRANIHGMIPNGMTVFWNVKKE